MKNRFLLLFLVVVLLAAMLPAAALAAKPAELKVLVRNATGAPAELSLTDANGNVIYQSLPAGVSQFTLTEGSYAFYVSTACGAQSGVWNVNSVKTLYVDCKGETSQVYYSKCEMYGIWENEEAYHPYSNFRWWVRSGWWDDGYKEYLEYLRTDPYYDSYNAYYCNFGVQPSDYFDPKN